MSKWILKQQTARWSIISLLLAALALVTFKVLAVGNQDQAGAVSSGVATLPRPAIHTVPSSDGTSIFIAGERLEGVSTPLYANFGPTSHERSHTGRMSYDSDTNAYQYTFEGLLPGDLLTPWVSIDTTITTTREATETIELGHSELAFHYVSGEAFDTFPSRDNNAQLDVPAGALTDTYMIIMDTVAPPGDPPPGHHLLNEAYSIRPSGAITQSQAPVILRLYYEPSLLGDTDPHTLSIFEWDTHTRQWQDIKSEPFGSDAAHFQSVDRFGTFALMTTTTWRDPFQDFSGLGERQDVRLAYGGRLELRSDATFGWAVSVPITPTGDSSAIPSALFRTSFAAWDQLSYSAVVTSGTALTVSVLDGRTDEVLLSNVADGASLAAIDPQAHPNLRLRVALSTDAPGKSPSLEEWAVGWAPATGEWKLYLPLLIRGTEGQSSLSARLSLSQDWARGECQVGCEPAPTPPIEWSLPVNLSDDIRISLAPALATDITGTLHVVWYDSSRDILYASKEPEQEDWSAPVNIPAASGYWPAIAVDRQGNVHVTWENGDIFYAMKPAGGADWTAPMNVSQSPDDSRFVALTADAVGNVHAVWNDDTPGNSEIYYAMRPQGGTTWIAPAVVASTPGKSWAPTIAVDDGGAVHVAWHDFTPGPTEIYYVIKPAGGLWSSPINVSRTTGASYSPSLAVDSSGTVHLVWQDAIVADYGVPFEILYAQKPPSGDWTPYVNLSRGRGSAEMPTLAAGPEDDLHIAWDTTDTLALLYVRRPGPEMGWTVPMTVTTISPGTQYPAPSIAVGPTETVHLLWSNFGLLSQDIFYSTAAPPPIPEDHVLVLDEEGLAIAGACIYQNGLLVGVTDDSGVYAPATLTVSDTLVALQVVAEQPTVRGTHTTPDSDGVNWAYRTALTSLEPDNKGAVSGYVVTALGQQKLVLHPDRPLVYFNLLLSIQWNATEEYVQQMAEAARRASNYLYDVSDGQMAFGCVAIYDDGVHWEDADMQILTRDNVRPYAYVGGIGSNAPSKKLIVGRHWDGQSGAQGNWNESNGFRTLIHEFGHYALYLYDSYFGYTYDDNDNVVGINFNTGCTDLEYDPLYDATNASIMDYQYATSELSAQGVPGLWDKTFCQDTVQWQENEESDWETLMRHYADSEDPARWQFTSPIQIGGVMTGPNELPIALIGIPQVITDQVGLPAPPRTLIVLNADCTPYSEGALIALDTQRTDGRQVTLDQGLTDSNGQISVYGAAVSNTLRAISIDGGLWAETEVEGASDYTLIFWRSLQRDIRAASASVNPYVSLRPGSDGRELTVILRGVEDGAALAVLVVPPNANIEKPFDLGYSPPENAYLGTTSIPAGASGLGSAHVRGVDAVAQRVMVDSDFALVQVETSGKQDLYSPDGNVHLHLEPGSFSTTNVYVVLMPTGAVPHPLPAGMVGVGNAYSVRASGSLTGTQRAAALRLSYDPTQLQDAGIDSDTLRIARWNDTSSNWTLLESQSDSEHFAISTLTRQFGIYALMAEAPSLQWVRARSATAPICTLLYLPLVMREFTPGPGSYRK